ncbi:MAG: right-handed parallel beta-helix repeat-containing protein [Planctomycetota bacterium]
MRGCLSWTLHYFALFIVFALPTHQASAEFSYLSEELYAWEQSDKFMLDPGQAADGMDPITYHRLFRFPERGVAVVLWQASEEELIYLQGQGFIGIGSDFEMILDAKLPVGGDVMYQVWSINDRSLVQDFVHRRATASFAISHQQINQLPAGDYELLAMVRVPNQEGNLRVRAQYNQKLRVVLENDSILPPDLVLEDAEQNEETADGSARPPAVPGSSEGFLPMDPSNAGNIYYVSSSDGNDSNDGLSPQTAVKTAERGYALLRDNSNDWMLFKAGDTFAGGLPSWNKSGISTIQPMIVGVYGEGGRPRFLTNDEGLISSHSKSSGEKTIRHVRFTGLHGYANLRDPDSPDFNGGRQAETGVRWMANSEDILFEDLKIEFFKDGIVLQGGNWGYPIKDVTVRRCIIMNQYADEDRVGHAQGIYVIRTEGTVIDQCFFDHNGWNKKIDGAHRTKFNHNIYCSANNRPIEVTHCIVARGAAHGMQLRPGGNIEGNLFVRNALGFFTTKSDSTVLWNIVLESVDLADDELRGIGIEVFSLNNAVVANNIVSSRLSLSTRQGMDVGARNRIDVQSNIVWDWLNSKGQGLRINDGWGTHENNTEASPQRPGDVVFLDPSRDLATYARFHQWGNSTEDTLAVAGNRPRGVWIDEASAESINAYIRAGFQQADKDLVDDLNQDLDLGLQLGF